MIPLAPLPPTPGQAATDPQARPVPAVMEAAAAPPPLLGAAAVTAPKGTDASSLRSDTKADAAPLEPPQDPPPVKGLGIPPLEMSRVGDRDKVETPPPSDAPLGFASLLAALDQGPEPLLDQRA